MVLSFTATTFVFGAGAASKPTMLDWGMAMTFGALPTKRDGGGTKMTGSSDGGGGGVAFGTNFGIS